MGSYRFGGRFAFLSFGVVLAYYGKTRMRWSRLLACLLVTVFALACSVFIARRFDAWVLNRSVNPYLGFALDPAVTSGIPVAFGTLESAAPLAKDSSVLARIQRAGELRVGFNEGIIPFSYRNSAGQLVGYDIAFAYQLARDLNVRLRLIPFEWTHLAQNLTEARFDIAMAGIYVTEDRLLAFEVSTPYFQSPLALFMPRERAEAFTTRAKILEYPALKIGVFNDPVLIPRLARTFPNAEIVIVPGYQQVPDFSKIDAAIWTLVQAESLAAAHPSLLPLFRRMLGTPTCWRISCRLAQRNSRILLTIGSTLNAPTASRNANMPIGSTGFLRGTGSHDGPSCVMSSVSECHGLSIPQDTTEEADTLSTS
jgi:ABC-type amino acid transport substrate-binding protein